LDLSPTLREVLRRHLAIPEGPLEHPQVVDQLWLASTRELGCVPVLAASGLANGFPLRLDLSPFQLLALALALADGATHRDLLGEAAPLRARLLTAWCGAKASMAK
jgi:hypothetical protein